MSNPFDAFTQAAAAGQVPNAPQNVTQPGFPTQNGGFPTQQANPFGGPPVQQPVQQQYATQPAAQPFGQQLPQGAPQQPQQGFGAPAGMPQQPQQGFGAMGSLPDLSDVGESGRDPGIPEGQHILQFKSNLLKTRNGHTAIALFTSVQSNSPECQPGSVKSFVKKLPVAKDKHKTAIGYALSMIRGMAGFNDEASFKAAVPHWSQILSAFMYGDPLFAQWAAGKKVGCVGTRGEEIIDKQTGQRTGRFYVTLNWFPVAQT